MLCLLWWLGLRLTTPNHISPELPASPACADTEMKPLGHPVPGKEGSGNKTVGRFPIPLASLGGHLNRKLDAPPGNTVLWRGVARSTDIHLGYCLARRNGGAWKFRGTDTNLLPYGGSTWYEQVNASPTR